MKKILYFLFRPNQTLAYTYAWVTSDGLRTQGSRLTPKVFAEELWDCSPTAIFELNATGLLSDDNEAMMQYN